MWLYVPSAFVPASECSTLDLNSLSETCARSCILSGKSKPPQGWLRELKKGRFPQLQYGRTSQPLMQAGFEAWLTSSVEDCHANHSQSQADAAERMTNGTSGTIFPESSRSVAPPWSRLRTSQESFSFSSPSGSGYRDWVIALRREYGARRKLVRAIDGSDSSALDSWATPNSRDDHNPSEENSARSIRKRQEGWTVGATDKGKRQVGLENQSVFWATPRAEDSESCGNHPGANDSLTGQTTMWPTPVANDDQRTPEAHLAMKRRMGDRDGTGSNRTAITSLSVKVQEWKKPHGMGGIDAKGELGSGGEFAKQATNWATPDCNEASYSNGIFGPNLRQQATEFSPQGQPTQDGPQSSNPVRGSHPRLLRRKLNPLFAAWLMGWPPFWVTSAPQPYGASATALFRQRLSRLLEN